MRLIKAEESKRRKAGEAVEMEEENRLYYERINTAMAKVDDDLNRTVQLW